MAILALLMIVAPYIAVSVAPSWRWLIISSVGSLIFFRAALDFGGDGGLGEAMYIMLTLSLLGLAIILSGIKLWLKGKGNPFGQAFLPLLGVPLLVFCYLTIVMVF